MIIHSKSEYAIVRLRLEPRSRKDRPSEKFLSSEATLANGTYRRIRLMLDRKKTRKIMAATELISITQEASFMSFTVLSAPAGSFTNRRDPPKNMMIMNVS